MLGEYAKQNFDDIFATVPLADAECRNGYNGTILQVDLSVPSDYVDDKNLLVLDKGCIDLTASIAYTLWVNGGNKNDVAPVNAKIVEDSGRRIGHLAVLWSVYAIIADAGTDPVIRGADAVNLPFDKKLWASAHKVDIDGKPLIVPVAVTAGQVAADATLVEFAVPAGQVSGEPYVLDYKIGTTIDDDDFAPVAAGNPPADYIVVDHPLWNMARKLESFVMDPKNKKAQEATASDSKMILHAIFGTAIHRKTCEAHSWFSADTLKEGSNTNRALGVAGSAREAFGKFMKEFGHDIVHHLNTDSLDKICDILSEDPADPNGTKARSSIMYMANDIRGKVISSYLKVSESAKERWPVGVLGKAAIVLGLKSIVGMLEGIMQRVKVTGGGEVIMKVNEIKSMVIKKTASKAIVASCRESLPELIVFAAGFQSTAVSSKVNERESIGALIRNFSDEYESGKAFATAIISAPVHKEALADAISSKFVAIMANINTAGIAASGYRDGDVTCITDVGIGEDDTIIAHARMMETLNATKSNP